MHPTRPAPTTVALLVSSFALLGCASNDPPPHDDTHHHDDAHDDAPRIDRFAFRDVDSNQPTGAPLNAEDAPLVASDGSTVQLADYRGKPVVLVFNRGYVGFICPYCSTYTAQIATRYDDITACGAEVLIVYPTREQDQAVIDDFIHQCNLLLEEEGTGELPFPIFLDPGLAATTRFNLLGDLTKPSTFILDAQGVLHYGYVGERPSDRPDVDRIVQEVRALEAP